MVNPHKNFLTLSLFLTMKRVLVLSVLMIATQTSFACVICVSANQITPTLQMIKDADDVMLAQINRNNSLSVLKVARGSSVKSGDELSGVDIPAPLLIDKSFTSVLVVRQSSLSPYQLIGGLKSSKNFDWFLSASAKERPVETDLVALGKYGQFFVPYLENSEPLMHQVAFDEVSRLPFGAMRLLKANLNEGKLASWINNTDLMSRRPLYYLLWGFVASDKESIELENRLLNKQRIWPKQEYAAIVAAYLELNPSKGISWVESNLLPNGSSKKPDHLVQATMMAISVQGSSGQKVKQSEIIDLYKRLLVKRPELTSSIVGDLNQWQRWEFTPNLIQMLKSEQNLSFQQRYSVILFLQRSTNPEAKKALASL